MAERAVKGSRFQRAVRLPAAFWKKHYNDPASSSTSAAASSCGAGGTGALGNNAGSTTGSSTSSSSSSSVEEQEGENKGEEETKMKSLYYDADDGVRQYRSMKDVEAKESGETAALVFAAFKEASKKF